MVSPGPPGIRRAWRAARQAGVRDDSEAELGGADMSGNGAKESDGGLRVDETFEGTASGIVTFTPGRAICC